MKGWEQALIMAFTSFVISAVLLVIAATSSTYAIFNLFVERSLDRYADSVVIETASGTFALILGIGLLILAYPVYLQEKKSTLPNPLPASKEA